MIAVPTLEATRDSDEANLSRRILRQVQIDAGRAASRIDVHTLDRTVTVRGSVATFYAWQVVHAACRAALRSLPEYQLDCAMTVNDRE